MLEIGLAFLAGAASTPHCFAMCGTLAAACGLTAGGGSHGFSVPALYNAGRLTTYAALGATAGLVGSSLEFLAPPATGFLVAVLGHSLVILSGFSLLFRLGPWINLAATPANTGACANLRRGQAPFLMGVLFGFLPCGILYSIIVEAAATGDPLQGGALLVAFGLGTSPVLFSLGWVAAALTQRLGPLLLRSSGAFVVALGLIGLLRVFSRYGVSFSIPLH